MESLGQIIEILGQIIGFLFAYYLLRLAYKCYGKNRFPSAVLVAWAAVIILLCSSQWFQVWAKSFIASNMTAKLNEFGQQLNSAQKVTLDMRSQVAGDQTEMDKLRTELDEIQSKIQESETNVSTIRDTAAEMRNQLASHQTEMDDHQKKLDEFQSQVRDEETNAFGQQSIMTNQLQQILAVQSGLASAQTTLVAQEKRLSDLERLIKQFYGKMTSETPTNPGPNN
jgi:Skp family chaperone for outer membrane proteins